MMHLISIAQEAIPGPVIDPNVAASGLVEAISSNNWGLVVGCAIMIIVWVLRLMWPKLSTALLPYIAVAIGAMAALGGALMVEPSNWLKALLAGAMAGLSAAGTWGLLGIARKKKPPQ